ncbi:MAG: GDSL-type esterase/lipase family protein [Candidatus Microthrix parvicella]|jgi:LPXTG-motif cell wall-anchored protein|uniref:SGNH/GDSL hydrolase family protein n=1 Tax=Candidatus Neomicrothrix sp. TaxID=2719034 RepID=UPI001B4EE2EA|nr:GDSL-type esterase/lipase family protein [Candidatus Microthrix sp.]MBP7986570.1 LPXTG cell wall anchor domain-containing protein [Candidatus Microthrix sp.]
MGFGGWNAKRGRVRTVVTGLGSVGLASIVVVLGLVTGAAAEPCDVAADLEYVALGDSYSSGYGLPDAAGPCDRSSEYSYPVRIQQSAQFGTFTDVSCAGARTRDFYTAQNGSNPRQLDALSEDTDVVTFTIGGNDLGFTDIITDCATDGDCRDAYGGPGMPDLMNKISGPVGDDIQQAMSDAAAAAPNAEIFVLGYPDLLPASPTGPAWTLSCMPTSLVVSSPERTDLRAVQLALNEEIAMRASAAGATLHYVDTYTPSVGHDLCSSDPWVSVLNIYHPTVTGMLAMALLAQQAIEAQLISQCEQSTTTSTSTTTVSTTTSSPSTTTAAPPYLPPSGTAVSSTTTVITTTSTTTTSTTPTSTTPEVATTASVPAQTAPSPTTPATTTPSDVLPVQATQPQVSVTQPEVSVAQPQVSVTNAPAPPPLVTPATQAQPAQAPVQPAAQVGGATQSGGTPGAPGSMGQAGASQGGLATTGAQPQGLLLLGLALIGAGVVVVVLKRRRND